MAKTNGRPVRRDGEPFTATERRILALLSDGMIHTRAELHECLWDPESNPATVRRHVACIRKVLRPRGEDIIFQVDRRGSGNGMSGYRHVRLLRPMNDE